MTTELQEHKYQAIRLYHSNQITLQDLKALFRVGTVVAEDEYTSKSQQEVLLNARDRLKKIKRLTATRKDFIKELRRKKRLPLPSTRAEAIAEMVTNFRAGKLPHDWKRFGPLIRKGTPNPSRPGSSEGKIGRPIYRGFKKLNLDLDLLFDSMARLLEQDARRRNLIKSKLARVKAEITTKAQK